MAGRAQVNMWFHNLRVDFATIDFMKHANLFAANGTPSEDSFALIGSNGIPTRNASGTTGWRARTAFYVSDDTQLVVRNDGSSVTSATIASGTVTLTLFSSSTGRKVYTVNKNGNPNGTSVDIDVLITTAASDTTYVNLCRSTEESLLDAGQIWAPHFLEKYRPYGRLRFMDFQKTNDTIASQWGNRRPMSYVTWAGELILPNRYVGTATAVGNDLTVPTAIGGSSWSNGDLIQLTTPALNFYDITAATKANPCQLTVVGHPFSTGQTCNISPVFSGMTELSSVRTTVTVIDVDHFTLDGINSTSYGTFTGTRQCFKDITVTDGVRPAKRVLNQGANAAANNISARDVSAVYDSDFDALITAPATAQGSLPVEAIIDLSNELEVSPYVQIPMLATDDFILNFATMFFNDLSTSLTFCVSLSNEVWNSVFHQTGISLNKGKLLFGASITGPTDQYYGYRFYQAMGIVNTVFAGHMGRVERILEVHAVPSLISNQEASRYKAPNSGLSEWPIVRADSVAFAPYNSSKSSTSSDAEQVWKYKQGGTQRQEALAWLAQKMRDVDGNEHTADFFVNTMFPQWKASVNKFTNDRGNVVKMTQYEGGWGQVPNLMPLTASIWNGDALSSTDRDNFYYGLYADDLYGDILTDNLNAFVDAGGEYPSQYCLVATWTTSGMWGLIHDNIFGTTYAAYDAFVEWNNIIESVAIPYQSPENSAAGAPTIRRRRVQYENYDTIARREKIQEIEALKAAVLARGEVAPRLAEKAQEFVPYRDTMSITALVAELARVQQELEDDENMLVIALLN